MIYRVTLLALAIDFLAYQAAYAVLPTADEFGQRKQWVESTFGTNGVTEASSLRIIKEDSNDSISRGHSWRGTPFKIRNRTYEHGLAYNSTKQLRVHLTSPAVRFVSDIGLENNDDTQRGNGSVTFHVLVGGKEVFASPVMKLKDDPKSINIPLDGATEFDLLVGDGGDGRGYDQALWGGAEIELQDHSRLRLQDIPMVGTSIPNFARVSFTYAGKQSTDILKKWTRETKTTPVSTGGEVRELTFKDPETGMEVRLTATNYVDYPAVEWVAHFKNTGTKDSPLLENIQAADTQFPFATSGDVTLHWAKGGVASWDDFAPEKTSLKPGAPFHLQVNEGRSSSEILPFFNVEGANSGVVLALGWSGRWAATFDAQKDSGVHVKAGMIRTHLVLHPGEEIRTPSMLALFYNGNRWHGQNLLRQFILAHHRPLKDGKPMMSPITCGNWGGTSGAVHADNIKKFIENKLPIEYYWIDAGWYGKLGQPTEGWGSNVGFWKVRSDIYPEGFKPLSDALKKDGRELMVWFEPERVCPNTPWANEHKDWLLDNGEGQYLMNLGNPDALKFVTDFICDRINEFGLGCYRQDFNMDPAGYWDKADAPDRQGIAEIRHIEGLYAYWDGILKRNPHIIIDNCASGGRRIDLETIGRATPFWRTDGPRDIVAHQCHTYGLLAWVPLSATSQDREGDDYEFRSSMCSSLCINWNHSGDGPTGALPADFPFDWARRTLEQFVSIRDFYLGDYYPLTSYSQSQDQWMAYQLDRPDKNQGLVVVLRRQNSPFESARFPLQSLNTAANYTVTNLDTGKVIQETGRGLMEKGLPIEFASRPGSALLVYRMNQ